MNRHPFLKMAALGLVLGLAVVGCSEKKAAQQAFFSGPSGLSDAGVATSDAALPPSTVVKVEYSESDFVDSEGNRDPFRSYASLFDESKREKKAVNQRSVLLSQYGIDELKLAAIVTGGDYPRAMVIDPAGKGWVLKRGDFLGRSDTVHVGGANGTDYQLNWRVDRVRQGDVVLVREDPAQPNVPPSTRVIALHPEGEAKNQLD
jgi:type IV pilus assembly protein PilP